MMMQLGTLIPFGDIGGDPAVLREYAQARSEEHTSELQSQSNLVCRLLLEKKKQSTSHELGKTKYCRELVTTAHSKLTTQRQWRVQPRHWRRVTTDRLSIASRRDVLRTGHS